MNNRLFKLTNSGGKIFYVVALNETKAVEMAEKQWVDWEYFSSRASVLKVECLAEEKQYPRDGTTWLLIQ